RWRVQAWHGTDAPKSRSGCPESGQALLHLDPVGRCGHSVPDRQREPRPWHGRRADSCRLHPGAAGDHVYRHPRARHGVGATHAAPPAKLSVFVYEDDFPLNGENDAGGGTGTTVAPNEPGLGQFNLILFDDAGGTGDATGQMTYDMFNQPLSNSLAGVIDPSTGKDSCPISAGAAGITGTIVTCPKYEADGTTLSPLAGQAVIANLMP